MATKAQTTDTVLLTREDELAVLTLNRPERRNPLSLATMRLLSQRLREADTDPGVRAVILAANGPAFCAGHDLNEIAGGDEATQREIFAACVELMEAIQAIRPPVIAQVQGVATAAGCQLVATCDLAVAAEGARFATPGVRIGLFCSTPMVALARNVGRKRALWMLLTGEMIDAGTAEAWGLVNQVVPAERLETATRELARRISAAASPVVAIGKRAFYDQIERPQHEAYQRMAEVMVENALAADAQEGICAFLEKRPPKWSDR